MKRTRVLVVDDSALMRELLTQILSHAPDLEVVGTAADPFVAWQKMGALSPDVLTLDVEMPRMDGLTFLERLMRSRPTPVVMVSSLTAKGAEVTLRALELGAFDFVTKPKVDVATGTVEQAQAIIDKVRCAARTARAPTPARRSAVPTAPRPVSFRTTHRVIAMGASTGGTEALKDVLQAFPPDGPGVVIVQHMPEHFTRAFAQRLDSLCQPRVAEAAHGDVVRPGRVLIAPGNRHLRVHRSGAEVQVLLSDEAPLRHHRPAVDVLFESCAKELGPNAVGVLLTGMGDDGARGLLQMRGAGAHTIAQDEASCVVFGMPKEAIALGAAAEVVPLPRVAQAALGAANR